MSDERLQKILAECGIASRRRAEELIAAGKVKVNGRRAQVGDKADLKRDTVTVEGKRLWAPEKKLYLMLNKPRGFVTTLRDEQGRKCVADLVTGAGARVFPVGRLDRDSEGLLLLTNDGEFANADPSFQSCAQGIPGHHPAGRDGGTGCPFCAGMLLDGRQTAPAEFHILLKEPTRTVAEVVLYEGRNRPDPADVRISGAGGHPLTADLHRRGSPGDAAAGKMAALGTAGGQAPDDAGQYQIQGSASLYQTKEGGRE